MAKAARGGKRSAQGGGNFTKEQGDALDYYVSGEGMYINQYFRGDGKIYEDGELIRNWPLDKSEKEYVKQLDSALDKTVKEDTLYRSVDAEAIFGKMTLGEYANLRSAAVYGAKDRYSTAALDKANKSVGKTITDKGYMSTTRSAEIAEGWYGMTGSSKPVVLKIKTSKSTKGADVSKATKGIREAEKYDPQKETLLARGQSYVVKKIYAKNGSIYVDVNMK